MAARTLREMLRDGLVETGRADIAISSLERLAAGHAAQAGVLLQQALEIFEQIGAAEAPELLAERVALTGRPPAQ
jgi:hypothetical protein